MMDFDVRITEQTQHLESLKSELETVRHDFIKQASLQLQQWFREKAAARPAGYGAENGGASA